jgi:tetratricopeptide (TPR) repeat protein
MSKQKSHHVVAATAVGKRLREARERAGLSQSGLAGTACSPAYISRIEVGARVPSLQLLRQLGKRLGVSADFLATGLVAGDAAESARLETEVALRLDDLATARKLCEAALGEEPEGLTRSEALAGLGRIALREGRNREAIELLEEAAALSLSSAPGSSISPGSSNGLGPVDAADDQELVESLARAYVSAGEPTSAIMLLERSLERCEETGDVLGSIRFAALLGQSLADDGDLAGAERAVTRALDGSRDVADPHVRARRFWAHSRRLAAEGRPAAAERFARRTLETLRTTGDSASVAEAIELLARISLERGQPGEALMLLDEVEPLIRTGGSSPGLAQYRLERARALVAVGEREEAATLATQVAAQLDALQPDSRGRAALQLADLFRELGDRARAQEHYEQAIELAEGGAPARYLASAYRALADLLKAEGRRDEALDLLERALSAQTAVVNRAA